MENNLLLWDLIELAGHLRREKLFVQSEQAHLQELNEKVVSASSRLAQVAWVTAQQRVNLNRLVLSCPDATPASCCRRARALESTNFIDSHKVLGYQNCANYGELLLALRNSPQLVSRCLLAGDKLLPDEMPGIINSLVAGLYASCVLPQDKCIVLRILSHLITLQLLPSEYPRRLLRQGSCAFSRLYSAFHEGLFSGKLFLTAALHAPIMQLLMLEEKYLDIDPDKAVLRLSQEEKIRRFGVEGSDEYKLELEQHRASTISNLVSVTKNFISSLHENLHCFPSTVCWLVSQIYARLTKANTIPEKEVFAMCTDLVLTMFICPAIVTPEPYGITDAPISAVARFNLIQVAKILQMLAMRKYQPVDPKVEDVYSQFDKGCVSSIIETMLEGSVVSDDPPVGDNMNLQGLSRSAALLTEAELNSLTCLLRTVANEAHSEDTETQKELLEMLRRIPEHIVNGHSKSANTSPDSSTKKSSNILSKVGKVRAHNGNNYTAENMSPEEEDFIAEKVLVIPFDSNIEPYLGFDSEQKILALQKSDGNGGQRSTENERSERVEGQEKRTRFSLSHDDGSIGNTSDNLEVVSEAPSNHSVASSLEMETEDQNDNLSDMISANVSGRGSPNISGRDTPSSQITEGDEVGQAGASTRQQLDFNPPPPQNKHSRFDIDDKFGKFEIKTLIEGADETISLVSDTWSTDVLASDSEIVEQPPLRPLQPPTLPLVETQQLPGSQMGDVSETASEAWSTDVVASDSERLTEVDTDDTASVARSDDTGRSEVESRGEPDTADDAQSAVSSSSFRVIREEVRDSPTRNDNFNQSSVDNSVIRVTPKPEYRRKVFECVDSNRNVYSKTDDSSRLNISEKSLDVKPALVGTTQGIVSSITSSPTHSANQVSLSMLRISQEPPQLLVSGNQQPPPASSPLQPGPGLLPSLNSVPPPSPATPSRIHFRNTSQQTSSQEVSIDEDRVERDIVGAIGGCFSTASIASSTSSGSSLEARATNPDMNVTGSHGLIMQNGSVVMEGNISLMKPSTATGAIPKSISFDKTAERGDKESLDDDVKQKKSFFRNFKLPFKSRRGKSFRGPDGYEGGGDIDSVPSLRLRRGLSDEARSTRHDTSDDILAKYRRKPSNTEGEEPKIKLGARQEVRPVEPARLHASYPFDDAKKKLRLVLSTAEIQQIQDALPALRQEWFKKENELVAFLQLQLAEAINLQDRCLIPHLYETLRCVKMFNDREVHNLFESLKEDYKNRAPYVAYLTRCRQALLSTLAHLDRLLERVKCDRRVVLEYLTSVCVKLFLERREPQLAKFNTEFQALSLADEKSDLLESFLRTLTGELERDPIWQSASESQLLEARTAVERSVISRVYITAMYPNGDGDISRDQMLQEHVAKLAKVVTPNHKDLRIPKMFHHECPWLSAQAEIAQMAAYRTPRDKLQCVLRCTTTIMNLLSLACVPAADDLMPVLVYVLIMANPPSLLSTLEYVTSFYGNRLEGEEQYYWIQFCSAIEFIKTMDYVVSD